MNEYWQGVLTGCSSLYGAGVLLIIFQKWASSRSIAPIKQRDFILEWEQKHRQEMCRLSPWERCDEHIMKPLYADPFGSGGWYCSRCGHFTFDNLSINAKSQAKG